MFFWGFAISSITWLTGASQNGAISGPRIMIEVSLCSCHDMGGTLVKVQGVSHRSSVPPFQSWEKIEREMRPWLINFLRAEWHWLIDCLWSFSSSKNDQCQNSKATCAHALESCMHPWREHHIPKLVSGPRGCGHDFDQNLGAQGWFAEDPAPGGLLLHPVSWCASTSRSPTFIDS